jgi:murein L,D-transpeptidase YcbB/YkuD
MSFASFKMVLLISLWLVLTAVSIQAQDSPESVTKIIQDRIEKITSSGELKIGSANITSVSIIPKLYKRHDFHLLWTNPKNVNDLIGAIETIDEDGLDQDDYDLSELLRLRTQIQAGDYNDPNLLADFDLLLTDSLILLGYHLFFGKVDPEKLDPNWNLAREIDAGDPIDAIDEALSAASVDDLIIRLRPEHIAYSNLKYALQRYRIIQDRGGWEPIPAGPTLKKGLTDERVALLRKRLYANRDLSHSKGDTDSWVFEDTVEEAVIIFQARHRLTADGAVGAKTLEAMNVPIENRIDQIRVNLERARWILHAIGKKQIIVDIAGYNLLYYEKNETIWQSRVQVGKPFRKTPVFKSAIQYIEFNPTWTIPPTILKKDILPKVRRNPQYLKDRNIKVLTHKGKIVDPNSIDWSKYPRQRFPYILRQQPGPNNALGRMKFIFPNKHFVYLHDTPSKSLFERTDRAFSSGCIRVQKPLELAVILLNDPIAWSQKKIMDVMETKQTRRVNLPQPLPVLLFYWTVAIDSAGTIQFKKDVYNRDVPILKGLNDKFKLP